MPTVISLCQPEILKRRLKSLNRSRPLWYHAVRVQDWVAGEVMGLDVIHLYTLCDSTIEALIHLLAVVLDVLVVTDPLSIRLEIDHIHFIEPHQGHEETDIALRDAGDAIRAFASVSLLT